MSSFVWFIIGFIVGFMVFWCYNWITDKINLLKMGYNGSVWLFKFLAKKFNKEKSVQTNNK